MRLNKKNWALGFLMMLVVGSFVTTANAASGKPGSGCGYNVTSTIIDTPVDTYQLQSDGNGVYTTFKSGKDQVSSVIQGSCNWALDTTSSTSRGMTLTFIPAYGSSAPPFTLPSVIHVGIADACSAPGFGSMTSVNQIATCTMQIYFTINGTSYILALNPTNFSGSSLMQVMCTGANSSGCNGWTVSPDPATSTYNGGQLSAIGALHVAGNTTDPALGYYYVDFNILVHK